MTATEQWGLVVDEVKLNAVAVAADWWAPYAARFEASGQARILGISVPGAVLEIGPLDREAAEFMVEHMVEHGVHRTILTIRKWTSEPKPWGKPRAARAVTP
jgi:hypothetical protein